MIHKIEITDLQQTITIQGKDYILAPKAELHKMATDHTELKQDMEVLKKTILSILKIFGLLDEQTGTIRESVRNGDEGYIKYILKALKNVVFLMGTAQFSKKAEAELLETFSFIGPLIPVIDKHASKTTSTSK